MFVVLFNHYTATWIIHCSFLTIYMVIAFVIKYVNSMQEGLSKVHFTADRSPHASALYGAEEQAKQARKKVKRVCNVGG